MAVILSTRFTRLTRLRRVATVCRTIFIGSLVVAAITCCSRSEGNVESYPNIDSSTVAGVWEAIKESSYDLYRLDIDQKLGSYVVYSTISSLSTDPTIRVYEISTLTVENGIVKLFAASADNWSIELRGSGQASVVEGVMNATILFKDNSGHGWKLKLQFIKRDKGYIEALYRNSLGALHAINTAREKRKTRDP